MSAEQEPPSRLETQVEEGGEASTYLPGFSTQTCERRGPQSKLYVDRPAGRLGEGIASTLGLTLHSPRAGVGSRAGQSWASQGVSRTVRSPSSQQEAAPRARTGVGTGTPISHSKSAAPALYQHSAGKILPQMLM